MVYFDMEQAAVKDLTIALFQRCCETIDFSAGLAMQAYLRSGPEDAGPADRLGPPQRPAGDRAADQGRLLGLRTDPRRADGLARAGLDRQAGHRRLFRADGGDVRRGHAAARRARAASSWPWDRTTSARSPIRWPCWRNRDCRRRPSNFRSSTAWPIRCARPGGTRSAGPRVRARGRDDSRHGLPRPPAPGKHVEPVVAAGRFLGRSARRRAAGRARARRRSLPLPPVGRNRSPAGRGDPASAFARRCRAGRRSADVQRALARLFPGRSAAAVCERGGRGRTCPRSRPSARTPAGRPLPRPPRPFPRWRDRPPLERAQILVQAAAAMRAPPRSAGRRDDSRGGQDLARGRCRRLRGHRLLRVLRPRGRRAVPAAAPGPLRGRTEPPVASTPRRGRDHQSLELPLGHLCRHDHRRAGHGQHGRRQAVVADPRHRPAALRNPLAGRACPAKSCNIFPARAAKWAICWSAIRAWP